MNDKKLSISTGCLAAYALWVLTGILLALGAALGNDDVGRFGLAVSAAAATLTIRGFFVTQNRHMRNAFEIGRDSVTRLH